MKKFAITGLLSAAMMAPVVSAANLADVSPSHWAYKSVMDLYAKGIIKGDGTGKFNGTERITRYEVAALVSEAVRYVSSVRAAGGTIDYEALDTISNLMTELTDEMQVLEIRVEENSDAIAALRKDLTMKGKCSQGVSVPVGHGRLKIMGQAMFSLVNGDDRSSYQTTTTDFSPKEGSTMFLADYATLGFAADIDEKTSFYARANVYMGGNADSQWNNGVYFDDFMYIHVKDLWTDWDMSLGRIAMPFGHETAGMFRTNPYFVSNSMVDYLYGFVDGAYFSSESKNGEWYYGVGIHNGETLTKPERNYSHVYPFAPLATASTGTFDPFAGAMTNQNDNQDDSFGYMLHVGSQSKNGDLKWDLGYYTNGGDANDAKYGYNEVSFFTVGVDYRINSDWHITGEYVSGDKDANLAGQSDDEFTVWYAQLVHNLTEKSTLALRYGIGEYETSPVAGAATNEMEEMTFAYARKMSDNGTMILEYSKPKLEKVANAIPAGWNDDFKVIRASYRIDF